MGWFRRKRAEPEPTRPGPKWTRPVTFSALSAPDAMLYGGSGVDGAVAPRVERRVAISVPAVKRVRDLIAGTLGTLPIRAYNARRQTVRNGLFEQPEPDVARSVTMTRTVEDLLFEGLSWWRVEAFDSFGFPVKVVRLEPRSVNVREDHRVYVNRDGITQGSRWEYVPDAELIRIDSPNDALLVAGARAIRAALMLDRAASQYAAEPLPLGYFTPRDGFDPEDPEKIESILDDWEDARRSRAWGYVGAQLDAKTLQWNPEQLQLSAARDYAVLEISRLGGVDPEELGVSTTSRTYANAEQRRLDLLDFTLLAYVTAIETRLSMNDVLPRGQYARVQFTGFLRSDTLTRMQTYEAGRRVGVYNSERIAELEDIPSADPEPAPSAAPAPDPSQRPNLRPVPTRQEDRAVSSTLDRPAVTFSDRGTVTLGFALSEAEAEFKVDSARRVISGVAVPWGHVARSSGARWKFTRDSLVWTDTGRVKLNREHFRDESVGRAISLVSTDKGLATTFKIARGAEGDRVLSLAEDGVLDGLSVEVDFNEAGGWTVDPADDSVRLITASAPATLRAVAITAMPAFDDARVSRVAASRERTPAMGTTTAPAEPTPIAPTPPTAPSTPDVAAFTAGVSEAVRTAVEAAFAKLPLPQDPPPERETVPAGRVQVTREAAVYAMNGHGPSLVRDAWKSRTEGDPDARDRLMKFSKQTQEAAEEAQRRLYFTAGSTSNLAEIVPPGYRPELYVTQLMQGRPLVTSVSRGTLTDATPFTLPRFTSATGLTDDHTEGTNPDPGDGRTIDIATVTVTPGAISGVFQLTREIVDSANPAIDAIAMQAMQESYSQQTEAKVYNELNGANGQGGVITDGFVPSGAQVTTTSGGSAAAGTFGGEELIAGVRASLALYPFRRFAAPNRAHLSQEATSALAGAVGSDGRPLLPSVGATNTAGVGNAVSQGWFVDGLAFTPTWSLSGNAAGDTDVLVFNSNDVWAWESSLLTFRFEERSGPANIDLALFGYFATRLLRPIGLASIRHTVEA